MIEEKVNSIQNIFLENREKLNVSGVNDVLSFDDKMVIVETDLGLLTIKGDNIRITKLSIDTSEISIDGEINTLNYSNRTETGNKKNANLLSKIFK